MRGCGCGDGHGVGVVPGPCVPKTCTKENNNLRIKTVTLPASAGTDEEGQPYAPKLGAYTNSIVVYQANGATYIYDSRGIYTKFESGQTAALEAKVEQITAGMDELFLPVKEAATVATYQALTELDPATLPGGAYVRVEVDELHNGQASLYSYDTAKGEWGYIGAATPYYTRTEVDTTTQEIDAAITAETTAREQAITTLENNTQGSLAGLNTDLQAEVARAKTAEGNLDTAVQNETTARQTADDNLQTQIDAIVASTDVKDVVGTKADLNTYDTGTLGNNDIIKVLNDESEGGAITYYRWNTETKTFTLIGETGPYYTKAEIDAKFQEVDAKIQEVNNKIDQAVARLEAI